MYSKNCSLRGTGCTSASTTRTATSVCSGTLSLTLTAMSSTSLGRYRGRQAGAVQLVGVLPEDLLPLLVDQVRGQLADVGHAPVRVARAVHEHVRFAGHLEPLGVGLRLAKAVEFALDEV